MPTPGAMRSGLAEKSIHVGPRELNSATMSSPRDTVPWWLEAPTVSTHGALPGDVMPPYSGFVLGVLTDVAGRGHHHDAGVHGPLGRLRQRVGVVRLVDARAHRQIDHPDTQGRPVGDRVVDRVDHAADETEAVIVQHLERDEVRPRGNAGAPPVRVVAVAGDDAGHVRAVAEPVVRGVGPHVRGRGEVLELHDPTAATAIATGRRVPR